MPCPHCGTEVPPATPFCPNCRAVQPPPAAQQIPVTPQYATAPAQNSGLAIAGFITSFLCGPIGFILSLIALIQISNSKGQLKGNGFAIAGMVLSFTCFGTMVLGSILFPVFAKAREKARQTTCMSQQRQMAVAVLMYEQDHQGTYPSSLLDGTKGYIGDTSRMFHCPSDDSEHKFSFGFNAALKGAKEKEVVLSPESIL